MTTESIELPAPDCTYADHSYPAYSAGALRTAIAAATTRKDADIQRLTQALVNAVELSRNQEAFCLGKLAEVEQLRGLLRSLDIQLGRGEIAQAREDLHAALHQQTAGVVTPTSCGYCRYEEADGELLEQCPRCTAADAACVGQPS